LDAQLDTCLRYVASKGGEVVGTYQDVKTGSSRTRPGLTRAIAEAKKHDATLVFSKLDRMARDAEYAHAIRNSGVKLYFCDFPELNLLLFGILVSFAQYERELGQKRTKDALGVISQRLKNGEQHTSKTGNAVTSLGRKRGQKGVPTSVALTESWKEKMQSDKNRRRQWLMMKSAALRGDTFENIASNMNAFGDFPPRGGRWSAGQVCAAIKNWEKYYAE
jgi:hypothetical protein